MKNEQTISLVYKPINLLYSLNYTCARISKQNETTDQHGNIYTRNDVFAENQPVDWIQQKLDDAALNRNNMIHYFRDCFPKNDPALTMFKSSVDDTIKTMMDNYNAYYDKNATLNDVFDGFICKDKNFAKLIFQYETNSAFEYPDTDTMQLLSSYQNFINSLIQFMTIDAFETICNTLIDEVTEYGKPTISFCKSHNNNLTALNKKDLEFYQSKANNYKKSIIEATNKKNKETITLYKSRKKRKALSNEDFSNQINFLRHELFDLITATTNCESILLLVEELNKRFESANSNFKTEKKYAFMENFMDIIAGFKPSNTKNGFMVDTIYVTKLELDYIDYLFSMLKNFTPESTKSNNQSQLDSEK